MLYSRIGSVLTLLNCQIGQGIERNLREPSSAIRPTGFRGRVLLNWSLTGRYSSTSDLISLFSVGLGGAGDIVRREGLRLCTE
jgi:hypothetical protein